MYIALNKYTKKLYSWLIHLCDHQHFDILLAILFFCEAIFFPIPIDPLLVLACLKNKTRFLYYGMLATVSSVLGGITAYFIGVYLWDTIGIRLISLISTPKNFDLACHKLEIYESWAVLIAGFTPFPYKAITLTTGFCRAPLGPFIIFSLISRGARFMLIAAFAKRYGTKVQQYIDHYGTYLLILFTLIFIISCFLLR